MSPEKFLSLLLFTLTVYDKYTVAYKEFIQDIYGMNKQQFCKKDCGEPLFLTPLLDENKLQQARNASYVNPNYFVPGIKSYSGFITVEDEYNSNLFFWYFPVMGKPVKDTPLLVWTQGGPGAPSAYGLFEEIGPFILNKNNQVEEMEYSWAKNNSVLFIDSPVGSGYSFTESDDGFATDETLVGLHLYSAVQQILSMFPELRNAPTYLIGSLYAAKHMIALGIQIHRNMCEEQKINLQGFVIPSGLIKPETQLKHGNFGYELGLITEQVARAVKKYQAQGARAIRSGNTTQAFTLYNKAGAMFRNATRLPNPSNFADDGYPSFEDVSQFLQTPKIRQALHVGNRTYKSIDVAYDKLIPDILNDVQSWLEELLNYYKFLFIDGLLGTLLPTRATDLFYASLQFDSAAEYRQAPLQMYMFNNTVSGYYYVATNIYTVCLLTTGNIPFQDNPELILDMVTRFFNGSLFGTNSAY